MNPGFRSWPRPRNKTFSGSPQVIDTTNGNTFKHGFGRVPGNVVVTLLVVTAANGYSVGEEVPISHLIHNSTGDLDGRPKASIRASAERVLVFIQSTNLNIIDSTASAASVTLTNYKIIVRCKDIERLK